MPVVRCATIPINCVGEILDHSGGSLIDLAQAVLRVSKTGRGKFTKGLEGVT